MSQKSPEALEKFLEGLNEKDKSDLAYLTGALADGSIYHNKEHYIHRVSYYQKSKDYLKQNIESRVKEVFGKEGHYYYDKRTGVYHYEVTSKEIFQKIDLITEKFKDPKNREVPQWIQDGDKEIKRLFVRGFFDADGSYYIKPESADYRVRFGQIDREVLKGVRDILEKEGFRCSEVLGPYQSKPHAKPYYELQIHGRNQVIRFVELIRPDHPNKQLDIL